MLRVCAFPVSPLGVCRFACVYVSTFGNTRCRKRDGWKEKREARKNNKKSNDELANASEGGQQREASKRRSESVKEAKRTPLDKESERAKPRETKTEPQIYISLREHSAETQSDALSCSEAAKGGEVLTSYKPPLLFLSCFFPPFFYTCFPCLHDDTHLSPSLSAFTWQTCVTLVAR